jgi:hypothetical protein
MQSLLLLVAPWNAEKALSTRLIRLRRLRMAVDFSFR